MDTLRQILAVTTMNIRSIPHRVGSSSVIIVGITGVVAVLVSALTMADSIGHTLRVTGRPDRALVLRNGVDFEPASTLSTAEAATISDAPGVVRTREGDPAATADMVTTVDLVRRRDGRSAGVIVRGMSPQGFAVRPEIRLVSGRRFRPGLHEVIVGRGAQREFRDLELGRRVRLGNAEWTVVGVYESGGGFDSMLLTDTPTLLSAYGRPLVSSVTVLLDSPGSFDRFKAALTSDPTLSVTVYREPEYYEQRSKNVVGDIVTITYAVSAIMAIGALFAALNAMHSAVSARYLEIATLRAIGFGGGGVIASVLIEALILATVGAFCGAAVAWLLFSGNTVSLGGSSGSIVTQLRLTPALMWTGIVWACVVGALGAIFPAMRAAKVAVATGLRVV